MKFVWGLLIGLWLCELANLFLGAQSGTAMPWQPMVGLILLIGGLCFFLALHIAIRLFSKGESK